MWISVLAALAAGALFAASTLVEHRATQRVAHTPRGSVRLSLIGRLLRSPQWVLGLLLSVAGFAFQALALAYGPITLVQPLLVSELLFALPIAVRLGRHQMGRQEWFGTVAVVGGLALFLSVAQPSGVRRPSPSDFTWLLVGGSAVGFAALSLLASRLFPRLRRATMLGVAAGAMFGLQSSLLKTVTYLIATYGMGGAATHWQPYALIVAAIGGLVCIQTAFQAGPLPESLPALDAGEPMVAVAIAVSAFGEQVMHSTGALALEFTAVAAVLIGIVMLDRSATVLSMHRQQRISADRQAVSADSAPA
jgi:drug/metabolite transporter (DMT)-like permease